MTHIDVHVQNKQIIRVNLYSIVSLVAIVFNVAQYFVAPFKHMFMFLNALAIAVRPHP